MIILTPIYIFYILFCPSYRNTLPWIVYTVSALNSIIWMYFGALLLVYPIDTDTLVFPEHYTLQTFFLNHNPWAVGRGKSNRGQEQDCTEAGEAYWFYFPSNIFLNTAHLWPDALLGTMLRLPSLEQEHFFCLCNHFLLTRLMSNYFQWLI